MGPILLRGLAIVALVAAGTSAAVGQESAAADRDVPLLIRLCESCHGPGGVSTEADIPSLAGQSADRIRESLEEFYFYERHCPTTTYRYGEHKEPPPLSMCSIASSLSDDEVAALATHFATQPPDR